MDFEDQQISTTSETGMEELETELNRARAHSARMRQKVCDTTTGLEQGLDILEENVKSLPELLREKDGNKAMKTRVKKTLETIFKQMKESIENVMKAVEAEEMELLRKERDQMKDREKTPEERKKSIKKSTDCNNNVVVNETADCENELTADRTPNALEPNNSAVLSLDRQGKVGFIDRATSPLLKPTQSKSGVNCGTPTDDELELLGSDIASDWIKLGRRLGVGDPNLEEIAQAHEQLSEKGYQMLKSWKQIKGADATYQALCDALQHQLVQRQDLVEKHCYTNGKEAVEIELHRARVHSARMRQIVSDKTTSLEERLKTLEEEVKSLLEYTREKDCNKTMETRVQEIQETTFKELKESIENIMKDFELEEEEFLRKARDQMDDRKRTAEECNNNVVLKEITSCENELAVERTPNAFESDNSPVSLDREENTRVLDGATQPLKLTRSKSEEVPVLHLQEKASKRIIFADLVTEEGSTWILEESGICIKFFPNAVQTPVMVTSSLWRPGTVSPPLEDDETLVSNIIELACDDPVAIQLSKVTLTLSHSATELKGYELVLKERIDSKENIWKDLETCCPLDSLGEDSTWQSGLRFAQAKITSFTVYAVISRLKSYKFLVTEESPEFTCTVTEYPDVSVTVPTRYLPAVKDFTFTLKVQQTPNDDYVEKGAFICPILYISCPVEVALEEPALIRIPITLEEKQTDLQNLSSSQISVFHRCTRKKSKEWTEITRKLKTPPKLENGVVSFQVKSFSVFVVKFQLADCKIDIKGLIPDPSAPQYARFLAYLCHAGDPRQYLLTLCCSPRHLTSEVRRDVSENTVILHGESTSDIPLNKGDRAFFHLPDAFTRINNDVTFLKFHGDDICQKPFPVLVEGTEGIHSINFFKFNNGREERELLCTVPMVKKSPLQGYPGLPASKPLTSEGEPIKIAKNFKLWGTDAELRLLLPLKDDLGNCWMELGMALGLSEAKLCNIEKDKNTNVEKAIAMLLSWKQTKGNAATLGHLAVALGEIGRNDIAHKSIEQLDTKEKAETVAQHALLQENDDQPRGESSSSIMRTQECKEDDENAITKGSELKDEQDQEKEGKQALESETVQKEITKLQVEVNQNNEDIRKLETALEDEKKLTKELQQRQTLKSLRTKVKQQEEAITRLKSDLKNETDLKEKLLQELNSRKY